MTSREDIALQLTKSIIDKSSVAQFDEVSKVITNIYNDIYNGIETHNEKPIEVLK